MQLHFYKYHGTGNDFILLDNRTADIHLNTQQIAWLCHRRFGIGADGLMLLANAADTDVADRADFHMIYYNSDGLESSMCGNGGRCITAFARQLGIVDNDAVFTAIDGRHQAHIDAAGTVHLHMNDVHGINFQQGYALLNTGSPHYVLWVKDAAATDVYNQGKAIRYDAAFAPGGLNVNFVQQTEDGLYVRTYERGVEDETMSCGTGVTAAAIAASCSALGTFRTNIQTPGGILQVAFEKDSPDMAKHIVLSGPAVLVFEGNISLPDN